MKENGTYENTTQLVNNTETTTVTYNAAKNFKAVILNADGQDFVRCILDNSSLTFFKTNISKITGGGAAAAGLRRMITWNHINEMVRDGLVKANDLKTMVINNLGTETDDSIYDFELTFFSQALGYMANSTTARQEAYDFVLNQLTTITER